MESSLIQNIQFYKEFPRQNPLFEKIILARLLYFEIEPQLDSSISKQNPSQNPLFQKGFLARYSQLSSSMYKRESQLEYSLLIGIFTHYKSWMIYPSSKSLHSSGHTSLNYLVTCLVLESMILLKQRILARIICSNKVFQLGFTFQMKDSSQEILLKQRILSRTS